MFWAVSFAALGAVQFVIGYAIYFDRVRHGQGLVCAASGVALMTVALLLAVEP